MKAIGCTRLGLTGESPLTSQGETSVGQVINSEANSTVEDWVRSVGTLATYTRKWMLDTYEESLMLAQICENRQTTMTNTTSNC